MKLKKLLLIWKALERVWSFVNGHHCGRFYEAGPTLSLYIPGPFLKKGINQIIIFETEGCYRDKIELIGQPKYL